MDVSLEDSLQLLAATRRPVLDRDRNAFPDMMNVSGHAQIHLGDNINITGSSSLAKETEILGRRGFVRLWVFS